MQAHDAGPQGVSLAEKVSLGLLTRVFPRDLIDEIIVYTGAKERRVRLLPAHVVVYFVLALGLFFGQSYDEVIRRLIGGLRFTRVWSERWPVPSNSALTQARKRLGEEPLAELFSRVAVPIAQPGGFGSWYRERRVMAIDGVCFDLPDTPANDAAFGRTKNGSNLSAFPQARIVALAECASHAIVGAVIGSATDGERTLASDLLDRIDPDMLVIVDRGLPSASLYTGIRHRQAHALFRVSSSFKLPALELLPDGSYLSVLLDRSKANAHKYFERKALTDPPAALAYLRRVGHACRVIEYRVENSDETVRLITSLLDPDDAAAHELATLYHERWEIELLFEELEIRQADSRSTLRSKSPDLARQEIWGLLLTHYAIRHFMHEAVTDIDLDERRLSFLTALHIVREHLTATAGFSPLCLD